MHQVCAWTLEKLWYFHRSCRSLWLIISDQIMHIQNHQLGKKLSRNWRKHINGLVQERRNSSALAMELCLSCTKPSMSNFVISSVSAYGLTSWSTRTSADTVMTSLDLLYVQDNIWRETDIFTIRSNVPLHLYTNQHLSLLWAFDPFPEYHIALCDPHFFSNLKLLLYYLILCH